MTEPASTDVLSIEKEQAPAHEATVRGQLLWASVFPIGIFILLSVLMITAVFRQLTLSLALQRNTAIVQAAANELSQAIQGVNASPNLAMILQPFLAGNARSFIQVNSNGEPVDGTKPGTTDPSLEKALLADFSQPQTPESHLAQIPPGGDEAIVSFARLPGGAGSLILVEPWDEVMAPGFYFQAILIALLILGAVFSLYTLSLSIGRVTHPITELVDYARRAVPGSLFRPMPEQGPAELRTLIKAFNKMVVQLAEQQTSLRQYAHKALLSQEEEARTPLA